MARTNATNSTVDVEVATVVDSAVATKAVSVDENNDEKKTTKTSKKTTVNVEKTKVRALSDSEEIDVVSLIPNVSYKDSYNNDFYKWEVVGHTEPMTYETIKNMWRGHKNYFRNLWLKPCDERVIEKFGLKSLYENYEFLMDESNYTRNNVKRLCDVISNTSSGMKYAIYNKIKNMIITEKISDVSVIRALEKHLGLDLISFLE